MNRVPTGFPRDFMWGGAMAANQLGGTQGIDGKGICVAGINEFQDNIAIEKRNNKKLTRVYVEEVAASTDKIFPKHHSIDFHHTYKEDLKLLADLGLKTSRTSINWSRIFPSGDNWMLNEAGFRFCNDLFDEIIENNTEPMITISHYGMPFHLVTTYKGWYSREVIGFFVKYRNIASDHYAGKIRYWVIIDQISLIGHEPSNHSGVAEDVVDDLKFAKYQAVYNEMVACVRATKYAHEHYPEMQIGVILCGDSDYPASYKPEDILATLRHNQVEYFFSDVFLRGYCPGHALRLSEDNHTQMEFDEHDKEDLKDMVDFFFFSYYYTQICSKESYKNRSEMYRSKELPANPWGWAIDPIEFCILFNEFYDRYRKPIYAMENGIGYYDKLGDGQIHDSYRVDYLHDHIAQVKEATKDGVGVRGYYAWGLIDITSCSFSEISEHYGFIYVDLSDYGKSSGERIKKNSYAWMREVIASGREDLDWFAPYR